MEENIKCCIKETISQATTLNVYTCWIDRGICEAVQLFADNIDPDKFKEAIRFTESRLPCYWCKNMVTDANKLLKIRLGSQERRILLQSPFSTEKAKIIKPKKPGRASDEANRRAIRNLYYKGLLWLYWDKVKKVKYYESFKEEHDYYKRAITLSPLGGVVIKYIKPELQQNKPIRWKNYHQKITKYIKNFQRSPKQTVIGFKRRLEKDVEFYNTIAGFSVRCGGKGARDELKKADLCQLIIKAINKAL